MAVAVGDGTTVTFASSGLSMEYVDVDGPDVSRESIDQSHLGSSGAKTFLPSGLYDPGEVSFTVHHDPALTIPITSAAETITIDWAGSGSTYAFSGFVTGYSAGAALDELMEATLTVKVTGVVTGI